MRRNTQELKLGEVVANAGRRQTLRAAPQPLLELPPVYSLMQNLTRLTCRMMVSLRVLCVDPTIQMHRRSLLRLCIGV